MFLDKVMSTLLSSFKILNGTSMARYRREINRFSNLFKRYFVNCSFSTETFLLAKFILRALYFYITAGIFTQFEIEVEKRLVKLFLLVPTPVN